MRNMQDPRDNTLSGRVRVSQILCLALLALFVAACANLNESSVDELQVLSIDGEHHFTVAFQDETLPGNAPAIVRRAGGEVTYTVPEIGVLQMSGTVDAALEVLGSQAVMAVTPSIRIDAPRQPLEALEEESQQGPPGRGRGQGRGGPNADNKDVGSDLYEAFQWDIKRVTNDGASFDLSTGSHDVVVGVIDTGIYPDHPDLAANLLPGSKNFVPAGGFLDGEPYETGDPDDFIDRHGHGTHVAGAIAANGRILGVGPDLGFRAYKVFGASSAFSEWIWAAIIAAADDGVDVINMSLGGFSVLGQVFFIDPETGEKLAPLGNDSANFVAWQRVVQYASQRDVIVVAAAGNTGLSATQKTEHTEMLNDFWAAQGLPFMAEGATFVRPAGMPEVVTVSATGPDDSLASYSTFGEGFVTVTAPGGDVQDPPLSFNLNAWSPVTVIPALEGALYVFAAGTSMASPKAAAVAALIIDENPDLQRGEVRELLRATAEELDGSNVDAFFGHGMVNAYRALGGE